MSNVPVERIVIYHCRNPLNVDLSLACFQELDFEDYGDSITKVFT